jgi:hypothetical protein
MKSTELAYVAGLIDGEGTVTIVKTKLYRGRKTPSYQLMVRLEMTCEETIKRAQKVMGGVVKARVSKHPNFKTSYRLVRVSNDAYSFLKLIQRYCTTKSPQIAAGLRLQEEGKSPLIGPKQVPQETVDFKEQLFQEVRSYHKKNYVNRD